MSDEYYTYTKELVPEGRRAFALMRATEISDDRTSSAEVIAKAEALEAWLKAADPKPKVVK